ncbi:Hsp20/alpha crystallin family protein [Thiomicrorhabdus aquaedulcis]|uniref:Hsp20/alpha crystallin family protein n=1 Tax=Thiomicrorhabdus aquaedulcis TaxID=2211106 RepID=UPI000FDAE8DA|nr:Hsp20/alpha crystallin family protein [Thiomicrorhabdus aquaedulcis]
MSLFLSKFEPFKELKALERRIEDKWPSLMAFEANLAGFTPSVNTREGEYAYHIEVDLPGVNKDDIKVEVKDNRMSITGERKTHEEVNKDDYYRVESSYGRFERSFTLPDGVDVENVKANSKNGVLEVVIPKVKGKENASKKIKVD